jgi:hypothetical protein
VWIGLNWTAHAHTVKNVRLPYKARHFLTGGKPSASQDRDRLHSQSQNNGENTMTPQLFQYKQSKA